MKDVVAVLGEWKSDGPIHVELVAGRIKDEGLKRTAVVGLKAIAKALASCPPLIAECPGVVKVEPPLPAEYLGPVSDEVGSEDDSLSLALKIGSVSINVVIRADAEM